jgi:hypothetical protein
MPLQLSSNEHLDYIAALLDDIFRIPGTQIRFGLDALIGWVPGIGDAMASIARSILGSVLGIGDHLGVRGRSATDALYTIFSKHPDRASNMR